MEFALCLPIIITLVFGSIEASNAIYLKQSLTTAAYEAAREATKVAGTSVAAESAAEAVLDAKGISGYTITVTPTITLVTDSGTQVNVTVTAPANANSIGPQLYFQGSTMQASVEMVRQ